MGARPMSVERIPPLAPRPPFVRVSARAIGPAHRGGRYEYTQARPPHVSDVAAACAELDADGWEILGVCGNPGTGVLVLARRPLEKVRA